MAGDTTVQEQAQAATPGGQTGRALSKKDLYIKGKAIGKGAFADAFLCTRRSTLNDKMGSGPPQLVLKCVKMARQNDWQRSSTIREMELLQSLRHPYILEHVDSWVEHTHTVYTVTGYCAQGDLENYRKNNKNKILDEHTIKSWLVQLLLALQYLQEQGVIHRDIKTGNVFLHADGHVQLGDFGLASIKNINDADSEHDQCMVGTPHFMSPEVVADKGYDYSTDVWSLGVVMYELMAGKPPFTAHTLEGLMDKIRRRGPAPLPAYYSPELCNVILKCMLIKDASKRATVAELLAMPFLRHTVEEEWNKARIIMPDATLPDLPHLPDGARKHLLAALLAVAADSEVLSSSASRQAQDTETGRSDTGVPEDAAGPASGAGVAVRAAASARAGGVRRASGNTPGYDTERALSTTSTRSAVSVKDEHSSAAGDLSRASPSGQQGAAGTIPKAMTVRSSHEKVTKQAAHQVAAVRPGGSRTARGAQVRTQAAAAAGSDTARARSLVKQEALIKAEPGVKQEPAEHKSSPPVAEARMPQRVPILAPLPSTATDVSLSLTGLLVDSRPADVAAEASADSENGQQADAVAVFAVGAGDKAGADVLTIAGVMQEEAEAMHGLPGASDTASHTVSGASEQPPSTLTSTRYSMGSRSTGGSSAASGSSHRYSAAEARAQKRPWTVSGVAPAMPAAIPRAPRRATVQGLEHAASSVPAAARRSLPAADSPTPMQVGMSGPDDAPDAAVPELELATSPSEVPNKRAAVRTTIVQDTARLSGPRAIVRHAPDTDLTKRPPWNAPQPAKPVSRKAAPANSAEHAHLLKPAAAVVAQGATAEGSQEQRAVLGGHEPMHPGVADPHPSAAGGNGLRRVRRDLSKPRGTTAAGSVSARAAQPTAQANVRGTASVRPPASSRIIRPGAAPAAPMRPEGMAWAGPAAATADAQQQGSASLQLPTTSLLLPPQQPSPVFGSPVRSNPAADAMSGLSAPGTPETASLMYPAGSPQGAQQASVLDVAQALQGLAAGSISQGPDSNMSLEGAQAHVAMVRLGDQAALGAASEGGAPGWAAELSKSDQRMASSLDVPKQDAHNQPVMQYNTAFSARRASDVDMNSRPQSVSGMAAMSLLPQDAGVAAKGYVTKRPVSASVLEGALANLTLTSDDRVAAAGRGGSVIAGFTDLDAQALGLGSPVEALVDMDLVQAAASTRPVSRLPSPPRSAVQSSFSLANRNPSSAAASNPTGIPTPRLLSKSTPAALPMSPRNSEAGKGSAQPTTATGTQGQEAVAATGPLDASHAVTSRHDPAVVRPAKAARGVDATSTRKPVSTGTKDAQILAARTAASTLLAPGKARQMAISAALAKASGQPVPTPRSAPAVTADHSYAGATDGREDANASLLAELKGVLDQAYHLFQGNRYSELGKLLSDAHRRYQ